MCSEGSDYEGWLEDGRGRKVPYVVNRNTGNCLYEDGWIGGDNSKDFGRYKFYHRLTQKARNKLDYWYSFPNYQKELDSLLRYAYGKVKTNHVSGKN